MKQWYVSHDYADMKPISLAELQILAFDQKTDNEYADYLQTVLLRARNTLQRIAEFSGSSKSVADRLESIHFKIHENGAVHPFGEGGHTYCNNFYKPLSEAINELPRPLPPYML